jgi:hypothetical protein
MAGARMTLAPVLQLAPGLVVAGKYRLEAPLARGGMGSVWTARHVELGVPVAVKFLDASYAEDPSARTRFAREARAAATLKNRHIVDVRDYGVDGGVPYLVMELLRGQDLGARLRRVRRLSVQTTAALFGQLGRALRGAHEMGLVHRDLKPSNIFLAQDDDEEVVKILDFGIAKDNRAALSGEVTRTGELVGSPYYMSPEQIRGTKDIDARSDIWALGVIAFRCLTGAPPFEGDNVGAILGRVLADPIPVATQVAPDLPAAIDGFFARCLVRDRDQRFPSVRDMAAALTAVAGAPSAAEPGSAPDPEARPVTGSRPGALPGRMQVVSACALPVGSVVWQARSGAVVLTVVCKATFRLRPGESLLADEQEPLVEADRHWNDDPREGLRAASDLVPFKRRADVILVGHAHAPRGEPVQSLVARLCVGALDKSIEVFADRVFTLEGQLQEGPRFVRSPLLWHYAAGGPGTPNPVGVPRDARRDAYGRRIVPRLQPPGLHVTSPGDAIPTVGFGPIAPTWPERWQRLHHHANDWDPTRWREWPIPDDLDPGYFNVAPADQQVDVIRPNERIVLENLHAQHPRLVTSLAATTPEAVVERPGRRPEPLAFVCDTLWIDADQGVCSLTWRARVPLEAPDAPGCVRVTLAAAQADGPPKAQTVPLFGGAAAAPKSELPFRAPASKRGIRGTLPVQNADMKPALPWGPPSGAPATPSPPPGEGAPPAPSKRGGSSS